MSSQQLRLCHECGEPFKGRADKRYCSDVCRVAYHNRSKNTEPAFVRSVTRILKRNRKILMELSSSGKKRVTRDKLSARGFNFDYFTEARKSRKGSVCFYCYEQGYLPVDPDDLILIVRKELAS